MAFLILWSLRRNRTSMFFTKKCFIFRPNSCSVLFSGWRNTTHTWTRVSVWKFCASVSFPKLVCLLSKQSTLLKALALTFNDFYLTVCMLIIVERLHNLVWWNLRPVMSMVRVAIAGYCTWHANASNIMILASQIVQIWGSAVNLSWVLVVTQMLPFVIHKG